MSENTLYEHLGGHEGIRAVDDDFYDRLLTDEELAPFLRECRYGEATTDTDGFLM